MLDKPGDGEGPVPECRRRCECPFWPLVVVDCTIVVLRPLLAPTSVPRKVVPLQFTAFKCFI